MQTPAEQKLDAVTESRLTRCPGCATVFRITDEQLAFREGQVRCGHCRAVFDANDHFVLLDAAPPPDAFVPPDEEPREAMAAHDAITEEPIPEPEPASELVAEERSPGEEVPTRTGSDDRPLDGAVPVTETTDAGIAEPSEASASEPEAAAPELETAAPAPEPAASERDAATPEPEPAASERDAATPEPEDATPPEADGAAGIGAALGGPAERFEWKKQRSVGAVSPRTYAIAAAALVVALALQLVLEFRDALAAHVPMTRPLLAAACKPLGCAIGPLRDGAALSIDASDLQADPAHRGLLLLSATIRNRAGHAIAFPYLELMLTDSSDRVVVRRAFPPSEYASGSADLAAGIPPNGEHVVRMFLDASATQQAGYRVYLFYP
ncbi:MAG TPA: zinc-ribbon and DUF3426 domain-containing protein [Casimicrobiaceae bacterium]|nr:zinc-ribbon and DUF3426 domain-containing protein [Casimicrobiaceae bacterium]